MKKRSELFFSGIQVPVDVAMILLAAMSAFMIRDFPQFIALKPKLYVFPFAQYMQVIFWVLPLFISVYALEGLYNTKVTRRFWKEALKVFNATSIALVVIIVAIFLKREWFSSRFIILAGWSLVVAFVVMGRFVVQKIQKFLLVKKGTGIYRLLLIGGNKKVYDLSKIIKGNPYLGYRIVSKINNASIREIKEIKQQKGIDEIIVCDPAITDEEQEKLIDFCAINDIAFKFIPTTLQTSRFETSIFNGEPIIEIKHTPLEGWGRILKRTYDIVGSLLLTILFSPIMLTIAFLVKLESFREKKKGGPVIYKNERIGSNGKKFNVFKFRYMKWEFCTDPNTDEGRKALEYEKELIKKMSIRKGPLYKIKNDPRKTRVGNFIEKYSLDELPQLFNVIWGDMSLVGPRPHQEREVEKYHEYHRRLLTIKPGISGMAQVSGRSDLDFEDEYKLDVYYIENWSLWLDFVISLKTVGALLRRRNN